MEDYGLLTMEITPDMERTVKEHFNLEIEMIQGCREELSGGKVRYTLKIYDDQKNEMVKEFILRVIAKDFHSKESQQ